MSPGPSDLERLCDALLAEFATWDRLNRFVAFELGEDLGTITPPGPMRTVVFNVLTWADHHGRLEELVSKVTRYLPHSPTVAAVAAQIMKGWVRGRTAAAAPGRSPGGPAGRVAAVAAAVRVIA